MDQLPLLLAFVAAAAVLALTPGVDTALVLRAALVQGRWPAVAAALGVGLGCLVWGGGVALGLAALLQASAWGYTVVKLMGAAYLVACGIGLLLRPRDTMEPVAGGPAPGEAAGAFSRGLLTNLLNPKVGVFYVSFLPQFVPAGAGVAGYTFFLAALHVGLSLAWFGLLIAATAPLYDLLRRPAAVRTLDRLTGGIFVGFGVKLAASSAA